MEKRQTPPCQVRGFTLVELIITLGLLAILAGSAAFGLSHLSDTRERQAALHDARRLCDALNTHNAMVPPERAVIDTAQSGGLETAPLQDYRHYAAAGSSVYRLTALGTYELSVIFGSEFELSRALGNIRYVIPESTADELRYVPLFCGVWEPLDAAELVVL